MRNIKLNNIAFKIVSTTVITLKLVDDISIANIDSQVVIIGQL
jgi:hypothetical protein